MNGSAERIDGSNGSYENPWDSLAEVKFKGADKKEATTVSSTVENAVERADVKFDNFVAGWQERMAKRRQERLNGRFEARAATKADAEEKLEDAVANADEAKNTLEEAILNVREVENGITDNKEKISELTKETRLGDQIKIQAKQVGEVIKAGGEVLKAGLRKFMAETLYRIKLPRIEFKSARDIVNEGRNGQRRESEKIRQNEAEEKNESGRESVRDFNSAKEAFNKARAGLGENRQNRKNKLESLKKEREDLKMNRELLSVAKKESSEAQLAVSEAEANRAKAGKEFAASVSAFEKAEARKNAADAKVAEISGKIKTQENIIKFQEELGSMSPARLREQLERKREEVEKKKQEKTENILAAVAIMSKAKVSVEDLDEEQRGILEEKLKEFDDELAGIEANEKVLDDYMNYRRGRVKNILNNPAGRGVVRELRAA